VGSVTDVVDRRRASNRSGDPMWRILGLATLTSALTGPGQTIGVAVFIDHFVSDLSLSREAVSIAYMIGTLTGATILPSVGTWVDRRGVRRAQIVVGALFALALVNMSLVNGIVWLAVGFTGIRLLGQGSLSLISIVAVSISFTDKRGTALGIFAVVSNALMTMVPIGLAAAIAWVGWRSAWLVAAVVVVSTVVPIAVFGLRSMPTGTQGADDDADVADAFSVDRATAVRTRGFWILVAVSGSAGMLSTALNFHQIDLLGDAGLSDNAAAAMFMPQVVGSTVAGLAFGWIADRVGHRYLPAVSMALLFAAHVLAANAAPGPSVLIYAVCLGAAGGSIRTVSSLLLPEWFGTAHLGSIQGALTLFNVAGSALGPVALAALQSTTGSYPPAILILSAIPAAALIFSLARPNTRQQQPADTLAPVDRAN
jgi:MFS family permease